VAKNLHLFRNLNNEYAIAREILSIQGNLSTSNKGLSEGEEKIDTIDKIH